MINEAAGEVLMDEPLLLPNKQLRHRLVVRKISTGEITFSMTLDDSIAGIRAGGVNQQFITVGAFNFSDKLHSIFGIVDRKRGKFLRQDLGEFANHGVASNGRFAAHSEVLKSLLRLDSISLSDSGEVTLSRCLAAVTIALVITLLQQPSSIAAKPRTQMMSSLLRFSTSTEWSLLINWKFHSTERAVDAGN